MLRCGMMMMAIMMIMMGIICVQAGKVEAAARGEPVAVQRAIGALIARSNWRQILVRWSVIDAAAEAKRSVAF